MNVITGLSGQGIEWDSPSITSINEALDSASCRLERLRTLFRSNTSEMHEVFIENAEGLGEYHRRRAYDLLMIYTLASEKLDEIDAIVAAVTEAAYDQLKTSVGKHTELRQRTDWAEAVSAYNAADAASVDTKNPDSVVDAAADAFKRLVDTRPPNLRCLHEKLTLIQAAGGWHTDGVIDAVFTDVEALARKHEILGSAAQAEG